MLKKAMGIPLQTFSKFYYMFGIWFGILHIMQFQMMFKES